MREFITDGCSGIPDMWIRSCCVAHDYAAHIGIPDPDADLEFLVCIVKESEFLGPFAYIFAGVLLAGLTIFRPAYRLYQRLFKKGAWSKDSDILDKTEDS